ncbi:MAG TPA: signal recognition particle receptor subunit alpha, partial [Acidimicrobiales bacterium]
MEAPLLLLILIVVVLVFGLGVVFVNRAKDRRNQVELEPPARGGTATITRPPVEVPAETVAEIDEALAPVVEAAEAPETEEEAGPVVIERPRFRDRLGKARAALATAFTGVRARRVIDDETWDDLEEALLRADVGVKVTMDLLDELKGRVRAKEIA